MTPDYHAMYCELRKQLNIHESHSHERCLEYVRMHNDRKRVADEIIAEASRHNTKLDELGRQAW